MSGTLAPRIDQTKEVQKKLPCLIGKLQLIESFITDLIRLFEDAIDSYFALKQIEQHVVYYWDIDSLDIFKILIKRLSLTAANRVAAVAQE